MEAIETAYEDLNYILSKDELKEDLRLAEIIHYLKSMVKTDASFRIQKDIESGKMPLTGSDLKRFLRMSDGNVLNLLRARMDDTV